MLPFLLAEYVWLFPNFTIRTCGARRWQPGGIAVAARREPAQFLPQQSRWCVH